MLLFEKFVLHNGLKVLVHSDFTTPLLAMNILYGVGSRNEDPEKTGFAHLFEHLMFGGSKNIPVYDKPLELAGGENNAFTNNDFTNYYLTIPAENMELAFWLESDRMLDLAFSPKSLDVQRNVVVEEFKQRYLNCPYGDAWLYLRPMAYKLHPYGWCTIGKDISHIENATMNDVKDFYKKWYNPGNAILVLSGNITVDKAKSMTEKWFGNIDKPFTEKINLPQEPIHNKFNEQVLHRDVPFRSFYRAYNMAGRLDKRFYACDAISDLLSNGMSSRFFQNLIKGKELFSSIDAFVTADADPGLFIIQGELNNGIEFNTALEAVDAELNNIIKGNFIDSELEKVKNKYASSTEFNNVSILNRAMNLAYCEWLGDANICNEDVAKYRSLTKDDVINAANEIFKYDNLSELRYEPKK